MEVFLEPLSHSAITSTLRKSGSVFAEEEAQLLISEFASKDDLRAGVAQRVTGIPLQVILGWAEFHGLRIEVVPHVFIPRLRSEFLADQAISVCRSDSIVVDLCSGTGAIGLAVLSRLPRINLYAADIDPRAVDCTERNIAPRGGQVFQGDLFAALPEQLRGRVEVIVSNAPYVPTHEIDLMPPEAREHEPRMTLDGGFDGLDVHRRIASDAYTWLAPGGHLLVETSEDQARLMSAIFTLNSLESKIVSSVEYDDTVVIGRKQ